MKGNEMYTPKLNETVIVTRPSGKQFEAIVINADYEDGIFSITVKDENGIEEKVSRKRISKKQ